MVQIHTDDNDLVFMCIMECSDPGDSRKAARPSGIFRADVRIRDGTLSNDPRLMAEAMVAAWTQVLKNVHLDERTFSAGFVVS